MLAGLPNKEIPFGLDHEFLFDFKYEGASPVDKECVRAVNIEINPDDLSTKFSLSSGNFPDGGSPKLDSQNQSSQNGSFQNRDFQKGSFQSGDAQDHKYSFPAPGVYNVYNALSAIISAQNLGIAGADIEKGLRLMEIAFGRGEMIKVADLTFTVLLAKNPAGMNLVLQLLTILKNPQTIFLLNDKIADGRDVSWIWDSNFELLKKIRPKVIICSGKRAWELLLRIKYVYGKLTQRALKDYISPDGVEIFLVENQDEILDFIKLKGMKGNFHLIPTYTAMLDFRKLTLGEALGE
jgi:UDP-N-acetylmuramyl tripeptide synthase